MSFEPRQQLYEVLPAHRAYFAQASLDATPTEWLLARVTYRPSFRRISEYNTSAHAEHTVAEDPAASAAGQSLLLRKFDEADRNRQKVGGAPVQLEPWLHGDDERRLSLG